MATLDTPRWTRALTTTGNSKAITIPKELLTFLQLTDDDELQISGHTGKHGPYIAAYKKKGDENENNKGQNRH